MANIKLRDFIKIHYTSIFKGSKILIIYFFKRKGIDISDFADYLYDQTTYIIDLNQKKQTADKVLDSYIQYIIEHHNKKLIIVLDDISKLDINTQDILINLIQRHVENKHVRFILVTSKEDKGDNDNLEKIIYERIPVNRLELFPFCDITYFYNILNKSFDIKKEDYKKLLLDIFEWGSLPQRFSFDNERAKLNYISDVYDSILLKDVVERLNIKDITSFNKILQYVLETEGKEFSANNVLNYLKSEHHEIATDTLYNYLEALCSTFIMNKVYRYDIQGKSVLKTLNKYYATDLGIAQIKNNNKEVNYSNSLENIVYNDLIAKGYEVYIGKTKKGEVDFVATKNKDLKYIQVCYSLSEEETKDREFGAYTGIDDSYTRYVISLDEEDYSRDGIAHINIVDFLLGKKDINLS